ncbi:MAG: hypothetical protein AAF773_19235 [Cyanobacteria bacterium P01_D01_bin.115]
MSALSPLARMICDEFSWLGSIRDHHDSQATDSTSKYSYHVKGDLQTSPNWRSPLLSPYSLLSGNTLLLSSG